MSNADDAFVQATDSLIALYRSLERRTLDLPLLTLMPFLITLWSSFKFVFFFYVGLLLIVPVNLVILLRNAFPGHWSYRPFFLSHVYYVLRWIWRGEAPTVPFVFIRPLMNLFMKSHFESRLRRLRLVIVLNDELSDAKRLALLSRLDGALERWKSPRFGALFYTVVLPGVISLPAWYKQLVEFVESFGFRIPTDVFANLISEKMSTSVLILLALIGPGYLLALPLTAFLAKRGLFLGSSPDRLCFPGGQGGSGIYSKEREILDGVGLRLREAPIDLWIFAVVFALGNFIVVLAWDHLIAWNEWMQSSLNPEMENPFGGENQLFIQIILQAVLFVVVFFVAALRRGRAGRA